MKKRQKNFFGTNVRFLPGSATHGSYVHGSYVHGSYVHGSYVHGSYVHGSCVHGSCVHGSRTLFKHRFTHRVGSSCDMIVS